MSVDASNATIGGIRLYDNPPVAYESKKLTYTQAIDYQLESIWVAIEM
jgi:hypothetical protein